jgi:hypothetical protein
MGLERVRIALVRGFDIARGQCARMFWTGIKEQQDRRERRQSIVMVVAAAVGAWTLATKNTPSKGPRVQALPTKDVEPMLSGRNTKRRQDLGNSPTAGRSRGRIEIGSIDTKLGSMLAAHKKRGRNRLVEAEGQVALHRPLAA